MPSARSEKRRSYCHTLTSTGYGDNYRPQCTVTQVLCTVHGDCFAVSVFCKLPKFCIRKVKLAMYSTYWHTILAKHVPAHCRPCRRLGGMRATQKVHPATSSSCTAASASNQTWRTLAACICRQVHHLLTKYLLLVVSSALSAADSRAQPGVLACKTTVITCALKNILTCVNHDKMRQWSGHCHFEAGLYTTIGIGPPLYDVTINV